MTKYFISLILPFSLLFIGCSDGQTEFFPLKEGQVLEYRTSKNISTKIGADIKDEKVFTTTVLGEQRFLGKKAIPIKREDSLSFYSIDKDGVFQVAAQNSNQTDPIPLEVPKFLFKFPIKSGTTWSSKKFPNLVLVEEEKLLIDLVNSIDKTDEIVSVPSGTFKRCIRIRSIGNVTFYLEGGIDKYLPKSLKVNKKITIESYNWYAPGVGLIKSIEKNSCAASGGPIASIFCSINEGESITELTKYKN